MRSSVSQIILQSLIWLADGNRHTESKPKILMFSLPALIAKPTKFTCNDK